MIGTGPTSTSRVKPDQRFTRARRCPICNGYASASRGQSKRCHGYRSRDGKWIFCAQIKSDHEVAGLWRHAEPAGHAGASDTEVTYDYLDEHGALSFQVVRTLPKKFRQRRPDGNGGWIWNLDGVDRVPFRLRELLAAHPSTLVFIPEGEKDVNTAVGLGLVATCNPGGAGKFGAIKDSARSALRGRDVIIIADKDPPGRAHAKDVESNLQGAARSIRIVEVPGEFKDLSAWVTGVGATSVDVQQLIKVNDPTKHSFEILLDGPSLATEDPPLEYLVEGLGMTAGSGAPHLFAGYGFSGKSMLLQALLLSLASGTAVWSGFPAKTFRCIHVDLEQGKRLTKRRYQRLALAQSIDLASLGDQLVVACRSDVRLVPEDRERWRRLMTGRDVIAIDSWRAACPGVEENSSAVRASLDMLGDLSEQTGCRAIVVHHARKPNENTRDGRYSIRGSSGFFDGSDCVYIFSAAKDEPIKISCEKAREHGQLADDIAVEISDRAGNGGPKAGLAINVFGGERLVQIRKDRAEAAETAELATLRPRVLAAISKAFRANAALTSIETVRAAVQRGKPIVQKAVQACLEANEIHRTKVGRTSEYRPGPKDQAGTGDGPSPTPTYRDRDRSSNGPVLGDANGSP